jgi:hypothetical protein
MIAVWVVSQPRRPTMDASNRSSPSAGPARPAWNKGKLTGPKPPFPLGHVWSIRARLQLERRARDLALFNLAIDSKLRGCDPVHRSRRRCGSQRLCNRSSRRRAILCSPLFLGHRLPADDHHCFDSVTWILERMAPARPLRQFRRAYANNTDMRAIIRWPRQRVDAL